MGGIKYGALFFSNLVSSNPIATSTDRLINFYQKLYMSTSKKDEVIYFVS